MSGKKNLLTEEGKATLEKLAAFIPVGAENAIYQKDLAAAMGLNTTTLKQIIKGARRDYGFPVLSDYRGYYFSASEAETEKFVDGMTKQAAGRFKSISLLRKGGDED